MHRFQNSEQRHACRIQTIMSRESDDIVTISDHNFKMAKIRTVVSISYCTILLVDGCVCLRLGRLPRNETKA